MKTFEQFNDLDPYNEENWKEPVESYIQWKNDGGEFYNYLKQLNDEFINSALECLERESKFFHALRNKIGPMADEYKENIVRQIKPGIVMSLGNFDRMDSSGYNLNIEWIDNGKKRYNTATSAEI